MLERLFTSKTRVKLLELFILNLDKQFYLREIARKINVTPVYVRKELDNLTELGLTIVEKKGSFLMFSADKNNLIFNELKNIFLKTESVGFLLKEKIENFSTIKFALIFGSFANGTQNQRSDIDLLIVGKLQENDLFNVIKEFEEKTGRELNPIVWTEKEFNEKARQKTPLLLDIVKKKFLMIKGDEFEFKRIVKR